MFIATIFNLSGLRAEFITIPVVKILFKERALDAF
jgi:hypothetical protein